MAEIKSLTAAEYIEKLKTTLNEKDFDAWMSKNNKVAGVVKVEEKVKNVAYEKTSSKTEFKHYLASIIIAFLEACEIDNAEKTKIISNAYNTIKKGEKKDDAVDKVQVQEMQ